MELDKAIKERHSVRKFSDKKPNWRKIIECIDAARYASMAGNNYTLKFIMIDDEEKINKISEACQQPFISKAKFLVVACSNPSRTVNEYGKSGEAWTRQQAGAAIQNFILKIVESGLSTCWIGYFVEEHIKKVLDIPKEINVEAVFPIGFEFEKPKTRRLKIDLDRILYFNKYGNVKMKSPKSAD
ncbi:Coenzyme F420:L-glutamate ligase [uncultured archaeon]|nr:Coenzyme F420:L-glutamate ligase [uncultured archaeon]